MYNIKRDEIINYYKNEILTKIDPSLYKIKYNCFACYYRKFLLKQNSDECIFGDHVHQNEKWFSCHLLPITNPNSELLKLYNIVNNDIKLFLLIYFNQQHKYDQLIEMHYYLQKKYKNLKF